MQATKLYDRARSAIGSISSSTARSPCEFDGPEIIQLGAGDAFGEVALLNSVRRTATVSANEPGRLVWLDARAFVPAVSSHLGRWQAAGDVIDAHMSRARPTLSA